LLATGYGHARGPDARSARPWLVFADRQRRVEALLLPDKRKAGMPAARKVDSDPCFSSTGLASVKEEMGHIFNQTK